MHCGCLCPLSHNSNFVSFSANLYPGMEYEETKECRDAEAGSASKSAKKSKAKMDSAPAPARVSIAMSLPLCFLRKSHEKDYG